MITQDYFDKVYLPQVQEKRHQEIIDEYNKVQSLPINTKQERENAEDAIVKVLSNADEAYKAGNISQEKYNQFYANDWLNGINNYLTDKNYHEFLENIEKDKDKLGNKYNEIKRALDNKIQQGLTTPTVDKQARIITLGSGSSFDSNGKIVFGGEKYNTTKTAISKETENMLDRIGIKEGQLYVHTDDAIYTKIRGKYRRIYDTKFNKAVINTLQGKAAGGFRSR